jgi:hypothetical protein
MRPCTRGLEDGFYRDSSLVQGLIQPRKSAGLRARTYCKWQGCSSYSCSAPGCQLFQHSSRADSRIIFNTVEDTLLSITCPDGPVCSPIDSKRLKCSSLCKSTINGGKCFMALMTSVLECFLAETRSPPTIAASTATHKTHVRQLFKRTANSTVVFMIAQHKKFRISRYIP